LWLGAELFSRNNLFFTMYNNSYFIVFTYLNNKFENLLRLSSFGKLNNLNKSIFVFNKYNFFKCRKKKINYIYLNTFLLDILFKEYFFQFNDYMRPGPFVKSFFDNFNKFEVFRDLAFCIRYQ